MKKKQFKLQNKTIPQAVDQPITESKNITRNK